MIMLLHNAYAGFNYLKADRVAISGTYGEKGNSVVKDINGGTSSTNFFTPLINFHKPTSSTSTFTFMWVGTGTDEPQLLDYAIPNRCEYSESGLYVANATNGNIEYNAEEDKLTRTNITLIHNNGTEDVVITEVYLVKSTTKFYGTVFYKELLETPITLGAGKYLEITFTGEIKDGVMSADISV